MKSRELFRLLVLHRFAFIEMENKYYSYAKTTSQLELFPDKNILISLDILNNCSQTTFPAQG